MVNFREVRNESIWRITQHQQKQDEEEREHTAHEIYIHFSTEGQQMKHYRWAWEYSRATGCEYVHKYYTRVGTLIVATIYLQLIQNRYMFRSFTVL